MHKIITPANIPIIDIPINKSPVCSSPAALSAKDSCVNSHIRNIDIRKSAIIIHISKFPKLILLNSFFSIIALNLKIPVYKKVKLNRPLFSSKINLLLGKNSCTEEKIYITEKSLYQNILITGTIGSRQNKFCNGTISKTAY